MNDGSPEGAPIRLTDGPGDASHPVFSPDGRWVAYYRIIGEQRDIWIISSEGGQPLQFTDNDAPDIQPAWSPDGSMLAFVSERGEGPQIWAAHISEGKSAGPCTQVTHEDFGAVAPAWSADGSMIAFIGIKESLADVWVVSSDGSGGARRVTTGANARRVRWDPVSGDILVSGKWGGEIFSLKRVSLSGATVSWPDPDIVFGSNMAAAFFDISGNGKFIVYSKEDIKANIWMLESERGTY
jgi:TolB protein